MKTKGIPAIIMLLAGAITCIVTYQNKYTLEETLKTLLVVLVLFLIMGVIVKKVLDSFQMPGKDAVNDEGEIIEKQPEGEEGIQDAEGVQGQGKVEGTEQNEEAS